jgi:clan AA aspartic protease
MAEEKGFIDENSEAVLSVKLTNGAAINCVLDTGFNGTLILPRQFTEENSIITFGRVQIDLVEEKTAEVDVASAEVRWLGSEISVNILVSETDESLIGTQMLAGSVLEIDYKNLTVKITK